MTFSFLGALCVAFLLYYNLSFAQLINTVKPFIRISVFFSYFNCIQCQSWIDPRKASNKTENERNKTSTNKTIKIAHTETTSQCLSSSLASKKPYCSLFDHYRLSFSFLTYFEWKKNWYPLHFPVSLIYVNNTHQLILNGTREKNDINTTIQ